jgi:hypothetical protein
MSIDPLRAAALAAVFILCLGFVSYRIWAGHARYGDFVYKRSEEPVPYWFTVLLPPAAFFLLSLALIVDMGEKDFRFDQAVSWSLWTTLFGFGLIRALQTGRAGVGRASFARREEPREYWAIVLLYTAAEALAIFMLIHALSLPPS